jgi:pyrrolidone-carboxylate peptidase
MKLLITAFEPFSGRLCNTSADLLRELAKRRAPIGFSSYVYLTLPVDFRHTWPQLRHSLKLFQPDAVLLTGEKNQGSLTLEAVARNIRTSKRGLIPIVKNALLKIPSPVPVRAIGAKLARHRAANKNFFHVSSNAGNYLCNFTYYKMLSARKKIPTLFVHVPALTRAEFMRTKKKYLQGVAEIILELAKAIDGAGANCSAREN